MDLRCLCWIKALGEKPLILLQFYRFNEPGFLFRGRWLVRPNQQDLTGFSLNSRCTTSSLPPKYVCGSVWSLCHTLFGGYAPV